LRKITTQLISSILFEMLPGAHVILLTESGPGLS
jgi:hypothetical protein